MSTTTNEQANKQTDSVFRVNMRQQESRGHILSAQILTSLFTPEIHPIRRPLLHSIRHVIAQAQ